MSILSNKAPLCYFFLRGAAYCKSYYKPVNQSRTLPIRLIYLTNVVEVITTCRKTKQKQKTKHKESFAELKNIQEQRNM